MTSQYDVEGSPHTASGTPVPLHPDTTMAPLVSSRGSTGRPTALHKGRGERLVAGVNICGVPGYVTHPNARELHALPRTDLEYW